MSRSVTPGQHRPARTARGTPPDEPVHGARRLLSTTLDTPRARMGGAMTTREEYAHVYLRSPHWADFTARFIALPHNQSCCICGSTESLCDRQAKTGSPASLVPASAKVIPPIRGLEQWRGTCGSGPLQRVVDHAFVVLTWDILDEWRRVAEGRFPESSRRVGHRYAEIPSIVAVGKGSGTMLTQLVFPGVRRLRVERIRSTDGRVQVPAETHGRFGRCPGCQRRSCHVHSHYQRTLADCPCMGRALTLQVRVRRFRCRVPWCPRRVFTERLPDVAIPWARQTERQRLQLQRQGMDLGGEAGARHCRAEALAVSARTLLRLVL
jgi:hypothetical protein